MPTTFSGLKELKVNTFHGDSNYVGKVVHYYSWESWLRAHWRIINNAIKPNLFFENITIEKKWIVIILQWRGHHIVGMNWIMCTKTTYLAYGVDSRRMGHWQLHSHKPLQLGGGGMQGLRSLYNLHPTQSNACWTYMM